MSVKLTIKVLAGAVALALAGAASADMSTSNLTGSIVLNVFDESTGATFSYDTGLSGASFTGTGNYSSGSLAGDANYQAFLSAVGHDALDYSVSGALHVVTGNTHTAYFTADNVPVAKTNNIIGQGYSAIDSGYTAINSVSSSTTNSAFIAAGSINDWWTTAGDGAANKTNIDFSINSDALVGTAQAFYSEFAATTSSLTRGVVTTYLGKWNFSGDTLTYSAVPLPTPLLLLLSGLGLMGVIARRGKSNAADAMFGASAA